LIQDQAPVRNVDSENHTARFDCFKFLFHSIRSVTFATISAQSGVLLLRIDMSGIGAKRTCGAASHQLAAPLLTHRSIWRPIFAVTHNAALW
jgi:hypothetical protein